MNLIDRVKNILLTPKTEWPVIAAEPVNRNDLILKYVLVLAAIPAVLGLLRHTIVLPRCLLKAENGKRKAEESQEAPSSGLTATSAPHRRHRPARAPAQARGLAPSDI